MKLPIRTSLVAPWLRICLANAEDVGSIPGWGSKILHAPGQGSPRTMRSNKKSPCAASKTLHSQIN